MPQFLPSVQAWGRLEADGAAVGLAHRHDTGGDGDAAEGGQVLAGGDLAGGGAGGVTSAGAAGPGPGVVREDRPASAAAANVCAVGEPGPALAAGAGPGVVRCL